MPGTVLRAYMTDITECSQLFGAINVLLVTSIISTLQKRQRFKKLSHVPGFTEVIINNETGILILATISQICILKTTASFAPSSRGGGREHETVVKDTIPM